MAFSVKDVRPDPVLTRLAVEYGVGGPFVADMLAPVAMVEADTFKYAKWSRKDIKREQKVQRAYGDPANEADFGNKAYAAAVVEPRSLKAKIADEIRAQDPNGDTLDMRRTKVLTNLLRLEAEAAVAGLYKAAAKTSAAPGTKWDAANPTIRADILADREKFRRNCGMYPNVMVLPPIVNTVFKNDAKILDLIRYTRDVSGSGDIKVFENMIVVAPGAIIDTANPGATANIGDIWDVDEVYYAYVDLQAGDDLDILTAARQVRSRASGGQAYAAKRWRDPDQSANADWVAVECNQKELVIADEFILRRLDVLT